MLAPSSCDSSTPASPAEACVVGEEEAFVALYADNVRFAWRSLRRLGVAEPDLEDACQEVFLVVHKKLGEFDPARSARAWVFGICIRVAAKYRRLAARRSQTLGDQEPEGVVSASQLDHLEHATAKRLLDQLLAELSEDQRTVFVLFELEQLPMAEVAATLQCPLQTAYSRLHAARKCLELSIDRLKHRL